MQIDLEDLKALLETAKRAGTVDAWAEVAMQYAEQASRRLALARGLMEPLAHFSRMFEAKPLGGQHDDIYAIHTGTEWAARINRKELAAIRRFVDGEEPQLFKPIQQISDSAAICDENDDLTKAEWEYLMHVWGANRDQA